VSYWRIAIFGGTVKIGRDRADSELASARWKMTCSD
jgi:hypothetical protein